MYRNHIEKLARTRLDDVLLDEGVIERTVAEDALAEQEVTGRPLSEILFERQAIDEWDLAKIVATHYGLPFIDVKAYDIPRTACDLLPAEFCRERLVLPFDVFGHAAAFAVVEMPPPAVLAEIERLSSKAPFMFVAVRRPILDTLDEWEADARKKSGDPAPARAAPSRAAPAGDAVAVDPVTGLPDGDVPDMELVTGEPAEPAPEPTAHVTPASRGLLGVLPPAPLALGPAPAGLGVAVVSAGALGRMAARPETPPAAAPEPEPAPAAGEPAGDWQSIFDVEE